MQSTLFINFLFFFFMVVFGYKKVVLPPAGQSQDAPCPGDGGLVLNTPGTTPKFIQFVPIWPFIYVLRHPVSLVRKWRKQLPSRSLLVGIGGLAFNKKASVRSFVMNMFIVEEVGMHIVGIKSILGKIVNDGR